MHTVEQAIFAGPFGIGLDLDRVELKVIPDILRKYASDKGMTTLLQDGIRKIIDGHTDFKSVLAVCSR